jgi:HSP20 family protein
MTLIFEPFGPLYEVARQRGPEGAGPRPFVPATDVVVGDDAISVTMDVPGMKADDVTIELEGDLLTVRGERRFSREDERAGQLRLERGFGAFERTLRVPHGIDPDAIEATIADGVLTLRIPLPEEREPRHVDVADQQRDPAPATAAA